MIAHLPKRLFFLLIASLLVGCSSIGTLPPTPTPPSASAAPASVPAAPAPVVTPSPVNLKVHDYVTLRQVDGTDIVKVKNEGSWGVMFQSTTQIYVTLDEVGTSWSRWYLMDAKYSTSKDGITLETHTDTVDVVYDNNWEVLPDTSATP
jgi:hypothetical protein